MIYPLGDEGKSHKPAYVMLVGTHADLSHARKNSGGEFSSPTQGLLKEKVSRVKFLYIAEIYILKNTLVFGLGWPLGENEIKNEDLGRKMVKGKEKIAQQNG